MLRRKEDMKDWQVESLPKEVQDIPVVSEPQEVPEEFIETPVAKKEVKVTPIIKAETEKPVKKAPAKKKPVKKAVAEK